MMDRERLSLLGLRVEELAGILPPFPPLTLPSSLPSQRRMGSRVSNGLPGVRKLCRSRDRTHLASPLLLWGSHCSSPSRFLFPQFPVFPSPVNAPFAPFALSSASSQLPSLNCRVKNRDHTSQGTWCCLTSLK